MNQILPMESFQNIKDIIYVVRGVQVMLDADLAALYGYETRSFNQQVKNNIQKFDDDFRFQLTKEEFEDILKSKQLTLIKKQIDCVSTDSPNSSILISKNLTSNWGGTRKLPYVFTEQGVYMLCNRIKS